MNFDQTFQELLELSAPGNVLPSPGSFTADQVLLLHTHSPRAAELVVRFGAMLQMQTGDGRGRDQTIAPIHPYLAFQAPIYETAFLEQIGTPDRMVLPSTAPAFVSPTDVIPGSDETPLQQFLRRRLCNRYEDPEPILKMAEKYGPLCTSGFLPPLDGFTADETLLLATASDLAPLIKMIGALIAVRDGICEFDPNPGDGKDPFESIDESVLYFYGRAVHAQLLVEMQRREGLVAVDFDYGQWHGPDTPVSVISNSAEPVYGDNPTSFATIADRCGIIDYDLDRRDPRPNPPSAEPEMTARLHRLRFSPEYIYGYEQTGSCPYATMSPLADPLDFVVFNRAENTWVENNGGKRTPDVHQNVHALNNGEPATMLRPCDVPGETLISLALNGGDGSLLESVAAVIASTAGDATITHVHDGLNVKYDTFFQQAWDHATYAQVWIELYARAHEQPSLTDWASPDTSYDLSDLEQLLDWIGVPHDRTPYDMSLIRAGQIIRLSIPLFLPDLHATLFG